MSRLAFLFTTAAAAARVSTRFGGSGTLTVAVGSESAFLLSARFDGWATAPLDSPSLDGSRALAPSTPVAMNGMTGLRTSFGSLLVATDGSGSWVLLDAANATLVSGAAPQQVASATAPAAQPQLRALPRRTCGRSRACA